VPISQCRDVTWLLVWIVVVELIAAEDLPVVALHTFHSLMVPSFFPPPDARRFFYHGHQESPFTADVCSFSSNLGVEFQLQIRTLLSSPPLARFYPSGLHFSPLTYFV
jgi:hypothetical protein